MKFKSHIFVSFFMPYLAYIIECNTKLKQGMDSPDGSVLKNNKVNGMSFEAQ